LALDARFRGNDNAGDGYENIHKTLRLAAAVIQTRLLCAEGAILLSVLICVHVWSSFQPAQSVFEARYPAYSAEAGRPRSSRRRSCDCRTPASTSAPPSSCRGVGYIAKATVVMRTATTGVRLRNSEATTKPSLCTALCQRKKQRITGPTVIQEKIPRSKAVSGTLGCSGARPTSAART